MEEVHQIKDREELKEEPELTCAPLPPALHRQFSEQCFATSLCSSSTELAVLAACQLAWVVLSAHLTLLLLCRDLLLLLL